MEIKSHDDNYTGKANLVSFFVTTATIIAIIAIISGLLVLVGWQFNIATLKSILPHLNSMKPNVAIGIILLGIALFLQSDTAIGRSFGRMSLVLARICTVMVVILALTTLGEYAFGWKLSLDEFLFKDPASLAKHLAPGRMSLASATNFILLGSALFMLDIRSEYSRQSDKSIGCSGGDNFICRTHGLLVRRIRSLHCWPVCIDSSAYVCAVFTTFIRLYFC